MNKEKEFEIWRCAAIFYNGEREEYPSKLLGKSNGRSFKEACNKLFQDDKSYNQKNFTYWGCSLHDNKEDAVKEFGI